MTRLKAAIWTHQLNNYKEDVKVNYIFAAPNTAAAYFALFQKLNNYLIFDPLNNKEDMKCFAAAVATSLNNAFPHAVRSKNLYNIVIKGMKNTRQPQTKALEIPQDKIVETGIIDIALRDVKGNVRKTDRPERQSRFARFLCIPVACRSSSQPDASRTI